MNKATFYTLDLWVQNVNTFDTSVFRQRSRHRLHRRAVYSSDKPSAESCVFFLGAALPRRDGVALPIIWRAREAQREPLPSARRWSPRVCSHQVASPHASG